MNYQRGGREHMQRAGTRSASAPRTPPHPTPVSVLFPLCIPPAAARDPIISRMAERIINVGSKTQGREVPYLSLYISDTIDLLDTIELTAMQTNDLTTPPTGDGVRLVVWDLDEAFWEGTLGEDEAGRLPRLVPQHLAVVRGLSERGVVSSVCSRNDPSAAKRVLQLLGVWDLFVFAAISWDEPKSLAVSRTLAALSVAPSQALLIDDSATNRAEVRAWLPGLRTMHPSVWRGAQTQLWGQHDGGQRLLKLQGVVERKRSAVQVEDALDCTPRAFLRSCDVRVRLNLLRAPTDARWDRILELVQRTNRLNMTKQRRTWHWELLEKDTELTAGCAEDRPVHAGSSEAWAVNVTDRFADHVALVPVLRRCEHHSVTLPLAGLPTTGCAVSSA